MYLQFPPPTISSQYRTRYRKVAVRPGGEPKVEACGWKKGGNAGDVPLFQLDLARDRTRLSRNELLQVTHRVRGKTFHANCVLDAKKSKREREMEVRQNQLYSWCGVDEEGKGKKRKEEGYKEGERERGDLFLPLRPRRSLAIISIIGP